MNTQIPVYKCSPMDHKPRQNGIGYTCERCNEVLVSCTFDELDEMVREAVNEKVNRLFGGVGGRKFILGERVRKKKGSEWQGKIVGLYMTELNPKGYAVESEAHAGSVQIYPEDALELVKE